MVQKVVATELATRVGKNKATPYIIGGVVLVTLGLTYFGIVRPILCYLKVLDCGRNANETDFITLDAFNPQVGNPSNQTISYDRAKSLAKQIYDSISWYNDDEEAIYGAIRSSGSVANLSMVSRMYLVQYEEDLGGELADALNEDEMSKVKEIIKEFKT